LVRIIKEKIVIVTLHIISRFVFVLLVLRYAFPYKYMCIRTSVWNPCLRKDNYFNKDGKAKGRGYIKLAPATLLYIQSWMILASDTVFHYIIISNGLIYGFIYAYTSKLCGISTQSWGGGVRGGPMVFSRLPFREGKFRESCFRESKSLFSRLMTFSIPIALCKVSHLCCFACPYYDY